MTILELLERQARERPDGMALLWPTQSGGRGIRWGELAARVRGIAGGLLSIGIRDGDRVAIAMPNCPDLLLTMLGTMASGGVDISMDPMHHGFIVRRSLADAAFRFKVVADDFLLGWTEYAGIMDVERIIHKDPMRRFARLPFTALDELARLSHDQAPPIPGTDPDAVSKVALTAGCTALPKGIMLSQAAMIASGRGLASALALGPGDTYLSLSHLSSPWTLQEFLACAHAGSTFAFMDYAPHPTDLARAIRILSPDVLRMSSEAFLKIFGALFPAAGDGTYWNLGYGLRLRTYAARMWPRAGRMVHSNRTRRLLFGGKPTPIILSTGMVSDEIVAFMNDLGYPLVHSYGLTEACGFVTLGPAGTRRLGRPFDGVELRVTDDGEILLAGPVLMKGYFGSPAGSVQTLGDGTLRTRDLGRIDPEGHLIIEGSRDHHSKTQDGQTIPADRVADLLMSDELVKRAIVIAGGFIDLPYPVALIVPAMGRLRRRFGRWGRSLFSTVELLKASEVREALERRLAKKLEAFPPSERPRRFIFLPQDPGMWSGELCPDQRLRTPLFNMRRSGILQAIYLQHQRKAPPSADSTGISGEPIFLNVESEYDRPLMRVVGLHRHIGVKTEKVLSAGIPSLLAALEKAGFDPDYMLYRFRWVGDYEEQMEGLAQSLVDRPGRIIAVSCVSISLPFVLKTMKRVRELAPHKKVVLGGPGPAAASEKIIELFPWVDVVVNGEGEESLPRVIEALHSGRDGSTITGISCRAHGGSIVCTYPERIKSLDAIPQPSYRLIDPKDYFTFSVSTMRGCPNSCKFCGNRYMYGPGVSLRSLDLVIEEMEKLHRDKGQNLFWVSDDTFTLFKPRVLDFCSKMKRTFDGKVSWFCYASVDSLDEEMMEAMAASGCIVVFIGIESGSNRLLQKIKGTRRAYSVREAIDTMALASRYFATVQAGLIVGFPDEGWGEFLDTIRLAHYLTRKGYGSVVYVWLKAIPLTPLFEKNRDHLLPATTKYPWPYLSNYVKWSADMARLDPALAPWAVRIPSPMTRMKSLFLWLYGGWYRDPRKQGRSPLSVGRLFRRGMEHVLDESLLE